MVNDTAVMSDANTPPTVPEDCLQCRLVHIGVFAAAGAWTFFQRTQVPKTATTSRATLAVVGTGLFALSATRAFIPLNQSATPAPSPASSSPPSSSA
ncbi:hypothetical protein CAOG_02617 [Capsaspora owczarzaki ATCC 30864]|uniref:DUF4536 domain-containing protein n=1 Tax=Capsaspora owczarzaki (strain ATCC 30864) TaxID=595528 RepID=A0A0D2VMR3_CAPO3|nr:hypothetical protein CAOG_02617 [Capsaspora owczarzaki ATCC 30864]KJE91487.1 hypothetical protein CAOG_002617 [Capsaspora owczarzaki ATCC 30864]|eukprot:XP_004349367.2 hypothetical protein CAOG_02617 [Capsaspora owczarzaki ATCC 30864]